MIIYDIEYSLSSSQPRFYFSLACMTWEMKYLTRVGEAAYFLGALSSSPWHIKLLSFTHTPKRHYASKINSLDAWMHVRLRCFNFYFDSSGCSKLQSKFIYISLVLFVSCACARSTAAASSVSLMILEELWLSQDFFMTNFQVHVSLTLQDENNSE